jgi:hypothetical protein
VLAVLATSVVIDVLNNRSIIELNPMQLRNLLMLVQKQIELLDAIAFELQNFRKIA